MTTPVTMVELEERLLADVDGSLRASLTTELQQLRGRLQGELRQMNTRARYLELQGGLQAVIGALQVLSTLKVPNGQAGPMRSKT